MAWHVEKQSNGRYAVYSTRLQDYIVIDADASQIVGLYAEKGVRVYVASARAQLAKDAPVSPEGEEKIEASRRRGETPREPADQPIGATGITLGEF